MATIVVHKRSGERYVLLGSRHGPWDPRREGVYWGDGAVDAQAPAPRGLLVGLLARQDPAARALLAVARSDGAIGWVPSTELQVETVDGKPISSLLDRAPFR